MKPIAYIFALLCNGIPITYGHGAAGSPGKPFPAPAGRFSVSSRFPLKFHLPEIRFLTFFLSFMLFV
jgi:hypothetical protein